MKLDSIFKLDIICLLFSTTTSIPLNENTNDVNSNTVNDNNILESSLYLNNNDIDNNEMSSAIWIDDDSIDEITNSHLSNSYIPENYITGTFELKSTATTVINPIIIESSTISSITSAKETNNSEIAISDNTQIENEIIPTKVSEAIVLDEALPTNLVIETVTEMETEIESEIEDKLEYELEDELEDETRISEIESKMEIEIDDIETETEYETETSFISIPEIVALPSSNKYIFNKLPSDNDEVQNDTIDKSNLQSDVIDTDSLSPTDNNNPNNGYDTGDTKDEDEDEDENTDDYKHIISSHNSQYTNNNMKKLSNKNRFSQVNSSSHKSKKKNSHKNNKEHNHDDQKNDNKNQSSNHKNFHIPKFKHNPFSKNKHKEDDEVNTTLTTTTTTEKDNTTTLRTKTKTGKDNITSFRTKTISKPQRVNKPSQTVETPKVSSPQPSTPLATPTVSVLHSNVVNAVCWTLPDKPCCNSCIIYKSNNYTSSIVKYYGKENKELCGISDLCIVDKQDDTPNNKTVIDSKGNEVQKNIISNSNQNVKKSKKNEEDAIIKIPICWSNSLPCCEDCTVVTSSNESEHQYLGWENDNWCAIRDSCLKNNVRQSIKSNENVTPNNNLDTGLMIKETADSEKEYKYINTNCWSYPFYSCCDDCASAQVFSDPENNNYLGWEKDNWCGIPEDCF